MSQPESSNSSSFTHTYPSNLSSFNYTYHVFLSFRGPDTRKGFTGHLYKALSDKGIHTFMDDEELRKGEEITPALLKAIEESWIAIVVLSKNYASSAFCLLELTKILECVKQKGRMVLPIFYGVNPSDVRYLKGSYGEAFNKHEARFENDKEKVKKWKQALREVSNLSGWDLQGFNYEFVLIRRIVEDLFKKTQRIILHIANYPVGLKFQVKTLRSLLDIESNEKVIMVGIYGIGGIGKTTIACAMYNLIADQFEGVCFLANVREKSNQNGGLAQLQELLLSELVGRNNIKLSDVYRGIPILKQTLNKKKVLLILDDVNELYQLQSLAGGRDWFGSGSRIIITTRDEHLLDAHGVKRKYMVKALNDREAFKLLTWNAFKSSRIHASYWGILNEFVRYCNGLPLALEVIGSTLFGKRLHEWESAFDTYKKIPHGNIQEVLKVSYDHLDENVKGIFLDMACFFGGCKLDYVQNIMQNAHDHHPEYGVGVLIKSSLIKIDYLSFINMHELIRDMGREIVRQESPSNPGKRSRLWYYEDIRDVFEENKGTDEIKAIMLNAPRDIKVQWDGNALEKMKSLRILTVKNACFSCGPKHLPNSLRIMDWEKYPSSSLPSDFNPRKLTILNLNSSCLILDKPFQDFVSLREINLSNSNVERVPCVSGAPSLRKIILDGCKKLVEVHGSIGLLDKLETLSADGCKNLRIFPEVIHSTSLEDFDLTGCLSLSNFPQMLGIMKKITILQLCGGAWRNEYKTLRLSSDGIDSIYELQSGYLMLPKVDKIIKGSFGQDQCQERASPSVPLNVTKLSVFGWNLRFKYPSKWLPFSLSSEELDMSRCNDEVDQFLSPWHPCFASLKILNLRYTHLTDEFLSTCLPWFPNLQSLDLRGSNFTILPECIKECHYLRNLDLDSCRQLREIRGMPPNIKLLYALCTSFSVQSSSMLLSQAISMGTKEILLPGVMPPKWFACKQPSQSLSFWVRNKFPEKIALCLVTGHFDRPKYMDLLVNGIKHHSIPCPWINSWKHHIYLVHLERESDFIEEVPIDPEWNHVRVVTYGLQVRWMGVHIYKEGNGTENVRFTNPNSEKEKVVYLGGTNYKYAIHLTKKWRSLLGNQVLNFNRPLKYGCYWDIQIWNGVRKMQAPIKVKFLVWNAFQDALPTCMNLFRSKIIKCPLCPICETEYETIEHVFMFCEWTRTVWFGSDLKWFVDDFMWLSESATWLFADVQKIISRRMDGDQPYNKIMGTVGNICWAIWKGRNEYIYEDKSVDPQLALFRVKALCKQYSHCYPLVQTAVNSTNATTLQGQMIENNNKARGKSVLTASSNSNTKENIGQDGLSFDHYVTWDAPIASSSGDKVDLYSMAINIRTLEHSAEATVDTGDWRSKLQPGSRQLIVDKMMETLKRNRYLPVSDQDGLQELRKLTQRLEEKIYTTTKSQDDYIQKVHSKMCIVEAKFNTVANSVPSNVGGSSNKHPDPGLGMQSQVHNPEQSHPLPLAYQPQPCQQLLSQNIQNNIAPSGMPSSTGMAPGSTPTPVSNLGQAPMQNVVGQNSNMQNMSGQDSVGNTIGQGMPSNMFANSQIQMLGRQQIVPQQQQQQSQNTQYLYEHHFTRQKLQQGNIQQKIMHSHIQQQPHQQQSYLQPNQLQSSQQSVMQTSNVVQPNMMHSSSLSNLQQNQQSNNVQQSAQSMLQQHQHSQSVIRQRQQWLQRTSIIHPQQTLMTQQPILPPQQQQQLIVTWDAPITSSTGDKEQAREPKRNIETKKDETLDSIIMDTAIHKDQLATIRKKRKRNRCRCRCSSVRSCKKPRLDQGTKWKRNPMHLRLSQQLLHRYKPVFRKGS